MEARGETHAGGEMSFEVTQWRRVGVSKKNAPFISCWVAHWQQCRKNELGGCSKSACSGGCGGSGEGEL